MTTALQTGDDSYTKARKAILGATLASSTESFRRDMAAAQECARRAAAAEERRRAAELLIGVSNRER